MYFNNNNMVSNGPSYNNQTGYDRRPQALHGRNLLDSRNDRYIQDLRNQNEQLFSSANSYLDPHMPKPPSYDPRYGGDALLAEEIEQNIHRYGRQNSAHLRANPYGISQNNNPNYNSQQNFRHNPQPQQNNFDFKQMMNTMMMMKMMSGGKSSGGGGSRDQNLSKAERATRDRVKEITMKQTKMLEELKMHQNSNKQNSANSDPLKIKLERIEQKLTDNKRARLNQENTTKPMPKFMMFMQQNMMNQLMLAANNMDEQPLTNYPNIIPVPVDADQRVLPISHNPLVNFEKSQPTKPKNLDLNYDEINNMLLNDIENEKGDEYSVEGDYIDGEENESEGDSDEDDDDEDESPDGSSP